MLTISMKLMISYFEGYSLTRVVRDKRVVRDSSSQARGTVDMRWESLQCCMILGLISVFSQKGDKKRAKE